METAIDPYETLGVPRDASEDEIRRAYRQKSKSAHPDAGGDRDAWDQTSTALAVLTDPKRRKAFDETGRIDPEAIKPDNQRAAALQIIEQHIGAIVNAFPLGGFKPEQDPRRMDIPQAVRDLIWQEIGQARNGIDGGKTHIAYLTDIRSRFTLKNPDAHPEGGESGIRHLAGREVEQLRKVLDAIEPFNQSGTA